MASSARIDELLKKFDENPRRYFAPLANEYRKAGDVDRAIQLCQEHLPQQPGHMSGHIVFGQALFEARQFDEARRVFEAALTLDPENLIALRHLGDIARNDGDAGAARDWYQRVLDADPRNEEIAAQLASLESEGTAEAAGAPPSGLPEPLPFFTASGADPVGTDAEAAPPAAMSEIAPIDFGGDVLGGPTPVDAAPDAVTPRYGAPMVEPAPDVFAMGDVPTSSHDASTGDLELELPSLDVDLPTTRPAIIAGDAFGATSADAAFPSFDLDGGDETAPRSGAAAERGGIDRSFDLDASFEDGPLDLVPGDATGPSIGAAHVDTGGNESDAIFGAGFDTGLGEEDAAAGRGAETAPAAPDQAPQREAPLSMSMGFIGEQPLGLESMEFVPPSQAESHDPMAGHLLRDDEQPAARPSAFVTETMAELYLQQGFRDEALGVYRQLLAQSPGDENLRDRVAQLESGSRSSVSMAGISDSVIEAAQQRRAAPVARRTARAFFASFAIRRPATPRAEPGGSNDEGEASEASSQPSAAARVAEYDDFGFPVPVTETEAGSGASTSGAYANDAAERADELGYEDAAELPATAAIEPATLDYAAAETSSDEVATAEDAEATTGFDVVPAEEMTGDRYGALDEIGESSLEDASDRPGDSTDAAAGVASAGPVDSLFGGSGIGAQDTVAASTLASAFGDASASSAAPATAPARREGGSARASGSATTSEPATRPAPTELSLDSVFRDTPRRTAGQRREAPAFSFDQFFSDTGSGAGRREEASPPTQQTPAQGAPAGGESVDIEQFNAWLEGLKKK